jgi:pyruvate kinase
MQALFEGMDLKGRLQPAHLVAVGVESCIRYSSPAAVFVPTLSGGTARSLARFRMPVWVAAPSPRAQTCRDLAFSYGVHPVLEADLPVDWDGYVREWLAAHEVAGDIAILTMGPSAENPGAHHRMEIIDLRGSLPR